MTKEERDALIASARKTPWLDTMKRRETEALLEALEDAEKRAEAARRMLDRMADESHVFNTILENTQQERDEARAALGTWEAWDAEHHGGVRAYVAALEADQRRLVVAEQDAAQARGDLDEARAQLASLHVAASAVQTTARALPVLRTCGDCVHCVIDTSVGEWCDADDRNRDTEHEAPPPSWCPLRGGER